MEKSQFRLTAIPGTYANITTMTRFFGLATFTKGSLLCHIYPSATPSRTASLEAGRLGKICHRTFGPRLAAFSDHRWRSPNLGIKAARENPTVPNDIRKVTSLLTPSLVNGL